MCNGCQQNTVRVVCELEKATNTSGVFHRVLERKIIQGATADNFLVL
jgi:hypothetical protein